MLDIFGIWRKYWLLTLIIEFVDCKRNLTKENCTESTIGDMKCTDCTQKWAGNQQVMLNYFPPDLGTDIKCLYTYNLVVSKIGSEAFEKYPSLTHLYMIRNGYNDFAKNTLNPLKNLLYLNLTHMNWFENTEITWPTTLKILDVTRLPINTLVAPDLNSLEVVNLSETHLTEFPTLSEIAPLKLIVLHNIKMTNFKLDALAKYCKLQSLSTLNLTLGDNCQCLQMKTWLNKFNVKIIHDLNCQPDSSCKLEFSETSIKNRDNCLSRNSHTILFLAIGGVIAVLILILAGASYLYEKLLKEEEAEGLENTDGSIQIKTTRAPQDIEEETTTEDEEIGGT